ncbi:hypothetical protein BD289DRAFT_142877 [Coniella lustricola]|uniref:Secreted protein n=1 Tax=Coniella lustricola TaxID=2025994 RepID=A0A2T2ZVA0_9PEZI|nr:hypothetical protein BD289DRAFT_142877 [Coniella lustricola]
MVVVIFFSCVFLCQCSTCRQDCAYTFGRSFVTDSGRSDAGPRRKEEILCLARRRRRRRARKQNLLDPRVLGCVVQEQVSPQHSSHPRVFVSGLQWFYAAGGVLCWVFKTFMRSETFDDFEWIHHFSSWSSRFSTRFLGLVLSGLSCAEDMLVGETGLVVRAVYDISVHHAQHSTTPAKPFRSRCYASFVWNGRACFFLGCDPTYQPASPPARHQTPT